MNTPNGNRCVDPTHPNYKKFSRMNVWTDAHGNKIPKPVCIHDYTKNMSGVDISDQYMAFYVALRKSMKWFWKLFFHMFNMIILNLYLLNQKFGRKMCKQDFIELICSYLVKSSVKGATSLPQCITYNPDSAARLVERCFPKKIENGKNGCFYAGHVITQNHSSSN